MYKYKELECASWDGSQWVGGFEVLSSEEGYVSCHVRHLSLFSLIEAAPGVKGSGMMGVHFVVGLVGGFLVVGVALIRVGLKQREINRGLLEAREAFYFESGNMQVDNTLDESKDAKEEESHQSELSLKLESKMQVL